MGGMGHVGHYQCFIGNRVALQIEVNVDDKLYLKLSIMIMRFCCTFTIISIQNDKQNKKSSGDRYHGVCEILQLQLDKAFKRTISCCTIGEEIASEKHSLTKNSRAISSQIDQKFDHQRQRSVTKPVTKVQRQGEQKSETDRTNQKV